MTLKYQLPTPQLSLELTAERLRNLELELEALRREKHLLADRYELVRCQKEKADQEAQVLRSELARARLGKVHLPPQNAGEPVKGATLVSIGKPPAPPRFAFPGEQCSKCGELLSALKDFSPTCRRCTEKPPPKDDDSFCGERAYGDYARATETP